MILIKEKYSIPKLEKLSKIINGKHLTDPSDTNLYTFKKNIFNKAINEISNKYKIS